MLIERHLKQVSLASQGFPVDHLETGRLLLKRIDVQIAGGQTIRDIGEQTGVTLPPAQTERIAYKFREQKVLLKQFLAKNGSFSTIHSARKNRCVPAKKSFISTKLW